MSGRELVQPATDGTLTTTSLIVAEGTGNEHASVLRLIRDNLGDFEEFGPIGFEIRKGQPLPQGGFARSTEIAILNEPQATLLLTYMRNSDIVKAFKKDLVRAFYDMAQRLAAPALPDRRALAQMVIEAEDRADAERAARIEAEARSKELEAPASAWAHMASSDGDYMVRDAAKVLSRDPSIEIGQQRLFKFMQAEGWIFRENSSWKPYQTQVNCGRLVEKLNRPYLNERTGEMQLPAPSIRITPKGLAELHKRLGGTEALVPLAEVAS